MNSSFVSRGFFLALAFLASVSGAGCVAEAGTSEEIDADEPVAPSAESEDSQGTVLRSHQFATEDTNLEPGTLVSGPRPVPWTERTPPPNRSNTK